MFIGIHMCTKKFISFFLVNYHYHKKNCSFQSSSKRRHDKMIELMNAKLHYQSKYN